MKKLLTLCLFWLAAPVQAGAPTPYADYLKALQPLPAQLPAPRLEETGLGAMCQEGAAGEAAKQSALDERRDEVQAAGDPPPGASISSIFAPDQPPVMDCVTRFRAEFTSLRMDQQRLAHDYAALRIKAAQGKQPCRPPGGGEDPAELQADCDRSVQQNLAQPFANDAGKLWPSYWINAQSRIERLHRQLGECVLAREQAQNDAFKAGAQRQGNRAMAAFMRATREPVEEFAAVRAAVCHTVEAPRRASEWGIPAWITYGPAEGPGGAPQMGVFSLKNLP